MNSSAIKYALGGVVFMVHGLVLRVTLWYNVWLYKLPLVILIATIILAAVIRSNTPQSRLLQKISWSLLWSLSIF